MNKMGSNVICKRWIELLKTEVISQIHVELNCFWNYIENLKWRMQYKASIELIF